MISCKKCGSEKYVKNGKARGYQKYLCKEYGCNYIEGDRRTNEKIKARKAMCIMLYAIGKMSINKIAKTFGMFWSPVYRWINRLPAKSNIWYNKGMKYENIKNYKPEAEQDNGTKN